MKKVSLLSILLCIAAGMYAQKNNPGKKEVFEYEFEFTGDVRNGADSVFNVYCVIDQKVFDGEKEISVSKGGLKSERKLYPNKSKDGKCYFLLGLSTENITSLEISKTDRKGSKQGLVHK